MKEIYTRYTQYNLWANRRLAEVFAAATENDFNATIISSFPSVRTTFLHIWDAEFCWLSRLQGVSPVAFPSNSFVGDTKAVLATVLRNSEDFAAFVAAQPADFFEKHIEFITLSYGPSSQQAFEMIHHCMNHSTFHRGQLITMGRQLGMQGFPPTDFVYYLKELKSA